MSYIQGYMKGLFHFWFCPQNVIGLVASVVLFLITLYLVTTDALASGSCYLQLLKYGCFKASAAEILLMGES